MEQQQQGQPVLLQQPSIDNNFSYDHYPLEHNDPITPSAIEKKKQKGLGTTFSKVFAKAKLYEGKNDRDESVLGTSNRRLRVYEQWQGNERFFFNGRLVAGPNWKACIGSVALIAAPAGIFLGFVAPYLSTHVHAALLVFSCILPALAVLFLVMTACTDPGIIPRQEPDAEYLAGQKPRSQEVWVNSQRVVVRYNDTCHFYQPPRAHHCSVNDNCIERFDHHCPWVGTTIGRRNYRTFLLFVYTTTTTCLYVFGCCLAQMFLRHKEVVQELGGQDYTHTQMWLKTLARVPAALALMGFTFLFFWFIGGLSAFHCYLVASNQTTYENFRYNHDSGRPNPYSRGVLYNCWEVWWAPIPPSHVQFRTFLDELPRTPPVQPSSPYTVMPGSKEYLAQHQGHEQEQEPHQEQEQQQQQQGHDGLEIITETGDIDVEMDMEMAKLPQNQQALFFKQQQPQSQLYAPAQMQMPAHGMGVHDIDDDDDAHDAHGPHDDDYYCSSMNSDYGNNDLHGGYYVPAPGQAIRYTMPPATGPLGGHATAADSSGGVGHHPAMAAAGLGVGGTLAQQLMSTYAPPVSVSVPVAYEDGTGDSRRAQQAQERPRVANSNNLHNNNNRATFGPVARHYYSPTPVGGTALGGSYGVGEQDPAAYGRFVPRQPHDVEPSTDGGGGGAPGQFAAANGDALSVASAPPQRDPLELQYQLWLRQQQHQLAQAQDAYRDRANIPAQNNAYKSPMQPSLRPVPAAVESANGGGVADFARHVHAPYTTTPKNLVHNNSNNNYPSNSKSGGDSVVGFPRPGHPSGNGRLPVDDRETGAANDSDACTDVFGGREATGSGSVGSSFRGNGNGIVDGNYYRGTEAGDRNDRDNWDMDDGPVPPRIPVSRPAKGGPTRSSAGEEDVNLAMDPDYSAPRAHRVSYASQPQSQSRPQSQQLDHQSLDPAHTTQASNVQRTSNRGGLPPPKSHQLPRASTFDPTMSNVSASSGLSGALIQPSSSADGPSSRRQSFMPRDGDESADGSVEGQGADRGSGGMSRTSRGFAMEGRSHSSSGASRSRDGKPPAWR